MKIVALGLGVALLLAGCVTNSSFNQAYEKAQVYGFDPYDGVVLYLHGCGGLYLSAYKWEFAAFLMSQNLLVVAPDSFSDPRPGEACPVVSQGRVRGTKPRHVNSQIIQHRVKQTKHAIARLRVDYPNTKIFVWGHSEGAAVANLIDDHVDGIITTGHQCGYRHYAWTKIRKDVPLLVIVGTDDPYAKNSVRRSANGSARALCKRVLKSPAWKYVIVDGMGHQPVIRKKQVREAVTDFLGRLMPIRIEKSAHL